MSRLLRALSLHCQQRLLRAAPPLPRAAPRLLLRALSSPAAAPPASHPAWSVVRSSAVTEHAAVATLYQHARSGAQLLSVVCAEEEKVCGACF